ncbi:MAG: hypothetical protein ACE5FM_04055 [Methyloligellaceae bacterium]
MTPAITRRLYVTAWFMLGGIALVYFFTLLQSAREANGTQSSTLAPAGSVFAKKTTPPADPAVSQALTHMRREIDRLKASLEAVNKENAAQKAHIKTLETAFGQPATSALPPESGPSEPDDSRKEDSLQSTPAPKVEVTMLQMPGDGFAEYGLPGSPLPIAGERKPTRTLFAVELAKGLEPDEINARWVGLTRRHAKLLGQLQPRGVKAQPGVQDDDGRLALIAGPFNNAAAAARLCARLIAAGAKCEGTIFAGTPVGDIAAR